MFNGGKSALGAIFHDGTHLLCSLFLRNCTAKKSESISNRMIRTMNLDHRFTYLGLIQDFWRKASDWSRLLSTLSCINNMTSAVSWGSRLELASSPVHLYRQRHAPLNGSLQTDDYICPFSQNAVGQFVTSCLPRVRLSSYEIVAAHADFLPALVFSARLETRECVDSKRSKLGSSCCQSLTERGSFCLTQATNKGVVAKVTKISYYYY